MSQSLSSTSNLMDQHSENGQDNKKRKKSKSLASDDQNQLDAAPAKKSRREHVEETILNRFHQSQQLQGILKNKKKSDQLEGEEGQIDENHITDDKPVEEAVKLTDQEQQEADQVLNDVNQLSKEKRKKLAKDKKQFKQQQKQAQTNTEEEEKESKQDKALSYLKQWKRHREEWKFRKNIHIWLLKNWKHSNKIPDKRFKIFLKYIKSIEQKSFALKRLEQEAKSIVDSDEALPTEETNNFQERARNILQWIV